jgi:hypothetical protein
VERRDNAISLTIGGTAVLLIYRSGKLLCEYCRSARSWELFLSSIACAHEQYQIFNEKRRAIRHAQADAALAELKAKKKKLPKTKQKK